MKQTLEDYAASTSKSWRTVLQALGIAERLLLIPKSGWLTLALPENQDTGTTLELYKKPLAGVHCRILSADRIARFGETPPPWKITTSVDVKSNALPVVCPLDTLANGPSTGLCYGVFVSFGLEDLWVEDKREHATDEDEDTTIEAPLQRTEEGMSQEEKKMTHHKPHTSYIAINVKAGTKRADAWEQLKQLASKSLGTTQVQLLGYGPIFLKRDRQNPESVVRYKHSKFEKPDDGELIKKGAFNTAWTAEKKGNMKET